jgi:mitogen-activated protein kinase 1/3
MTITLPDLERDTRNVYRFVRPLGRGSYGDVFEAENRSTHLNVAIKRVPTNFDSALSAKRALREVRLLSVLKHPNITNLISVTAAANYRDFNAMYLVVDLMDTDMGRLLDSHQKLTVEHHQYFMYQLMKGLKYLHSARVAHRDIKPSNLFVNSKSELKIGDFGLARVIGDPHARELQNEMIMTRWYRAPEVLLNMSNYGPGVDVWSAGCVLAELMTGKPLFQGQSNVNMLTLIVQVLGSPALDDIRNVTNPDARRFMASLPICRKKRFAELFSGCDRNAIDLLERMLTWSPESRISVDDVLAHPFLAGFHDLFAEPVTVPLQDFDFERSDLSVDALKRMLWDQIAK